MENLKDKYGEFDSLYKGEGIVNEIDCQFEVGQLSDGTIILYCCTDAIVLNSETNQVELIGLTEKGKKILVKGIAIRENSKIHSVRGEPTRYYSWYRSAGTMSLQIGEYKWDTIKKIKFAITNFRFWGNETEQITETKMSLNTLKLALDGIEFSFRQVDAYDNIKNNLQSQKNTAVTCELIIDVISHAQEEIFEFVDTICTLLTIARGKKINWIYYSLYESEKPSTFIEHQPRITSPYQGYEVIDFQSEETVAFLEQCYPTYKTLNSKYHFDYVANILVDISSRGFRETRCLAIFTVAEFLARKVKEHGKYKAKIKAFADYYNIPISDDEMDFFVQSRVFIVHELKFATKDSFNEYIKNLHFLHLLILGILGYKSYYINVTKHPLHTGSRADEFTPTS